MRECPTLKSLRRGEIIDFWGILLKMDDGEIKKGDIYIAERNSGPKLLTAKEVVMTEDGLLIKYIRPTTNDYCFDGDECVKVREA